MKHFVTLLAMVALLNLGVASYGVAGTVKKQPLQVQEMVALQEMQVADYQDIEDIEAGLKDGYGILVLLLVIGVGYLIVEQLNEDDDDESKRSPSSVAATATTTTPSSTDSTGTQ